jgi:hypothetical protein
MLVAALETQVINAICKADDEPAILEFNFRRVALVRQMRHFGLDVRERDRFNCLSERHIRLYDGFAVRHVKRMAQQKLRIEHNLRPVFTRTDKVAFAV